MDLERWIRNRIVAPEHGTLGWMGFDEFMQRALYHPGLGYYSADRPKLGQGLRDGSDFATAPEISPLFGQALAMQLLQALDASNTDCIWEFGAGSGALAEQLLQTLGSRIRHYYIVDISTQLRQCQRKRLTRFATQVQWLSKLPQHIKGVVLGNEVLDAMPVKLLLRQQGCWLERGVGVANRRLHFVDKPSTCLLQPPMEPAGSGLYLTEIHPQAEAFIRTIGTALQRGMALFLDYGFPETEYYHHDRNMGTLMCHQQHCTDPDPLSDIGSKDITAHVNFTGIALAAQEVGLALLGYTSQGRFLINCGLVQHMQASDLKTRANAHRLIAEHEMGELYKVIAFIPAGQYFDALGFSTGDRSHRL